MNSPNDEEINESEFLPVIRIIDEEQREIRNLGVDRIKLKIKFLNPPEISREDMDEYNRVISGWLDRAFTALLSTAGSRLNIRPSDKVGIKFTRGNEDNIKLCKRHTFNIYVLKNFDLNRIKCALD